eukprot:239441-Chlamydomonas_euryale.AAC.9
MRCVFEEARPQVTSCRSSQDSDRRRKEQRRGTRTHVAFAALCVRRICAPLRLCASSLVLRKRQKEGGREWTPLPALSLLEACTWRDPSGAPLPFGPIECLRARVHAPGIPTAASPNEQARLGYGFSRLAIPHGGEATRGEAEDWKMRGKRSRGGNKACCPIHSAAVRRWRGVSSSGVRTTRVEAPAATRTIELVAGPRGCRRDAYQC